MCSHNIQLEVHLFLWTKWDKNAVCLIFLYLFVFIVCMSKCAHMYVRIHLHMPTCTYGGQTLRFLKEKAPSGQENRTCGLGGSLTLQLVEVNYLAKDPRFRRIVSHAKEMGGLAMAFMRCCAFPYQASHSYCHPHSPSLWGTAGSLNLLGPKAEKWDSFPFYFFCLSLLEEMLSMPFLVP